MVPLPTLNKALLDVDAIINDMARAAALDDFERDWKRYLHSLDRVWNKAEAYYGRSPKWSGWSGPFKRARSTDPLLRYLQQARHADEHTVEEITGRSEASFAVGFPDVRSEPRILEHLSIETDGNGNMTIESSEPLKVTFTPPRTRLAPVTNRGVRFDVPALHMGRAVDPEDIVGVARLARDYYESMLRKAEGFFCK